MGQLSVFPHSVLEVTLSASALALSLRVAGTGSRGPGGARPLLSSGVPPSGPPLARPGAPLLGLASFRGGSAVMGCNRSWHRRSAWAISAVPFSVLAPLSNSPGRHSAPSSVRVPLYPCAIRRPLVSFFCLIFFLLMVLLTLKRQSAPRGAMYCEGKLYWGLLYLCDTLEPKCRGLMASDGPDVCRRKKVKGTTAIPFGKYEVRLLPSAKFGSQPFYKHLGGRLPRLLGVPAFDGVLIHCGNTSADSRGCILVGQSVGHGVLGSSRAAYQDLFRSVFRAAEKRGERVFIEIV